MNPADLDYRGVRLADHSRNAFGAVVTIDGVDVYRSTTSASSPWAEAEQLLPCRPVPDRVIRYHSRELAAAAAEAWAIRLAFYPRPKVPTSPEEDK